jgi:protein-tyrosine phosphatase
MYFETINTAGGLSVSNANVSNALTAVLGNALAHSAKKTTRFVSALGESSRSIHTMDAVVPAVTQKKVARVHVLFACTGNICRSPVAKAVMSKKIALMGLSDSVQIDSVGTESYHQHARADSRSQHSAAYRGYTLLGHSARQITPEDFYAADVILAMDWANMRRLQQMAPEFCRHKVELLMRYAQNHDSAEIPDPYYADQAAFNLVLDYVEDAVGGLIENVTRKLLQPTAA